MTEAEVVGVYIALRDRRAARKAAFTVDDEKDKGAQEKIEAALLKRFQANGITSLAIKGVGTAYTSSRTSASVADKEAFFNFVKDNDEWALTDIRASKANIELYKEQNQALPPGINYSEEITVNVRRSA